MHIERRIHEKLTAAFAPQRLTVHNDSSKHADHYEPHDANAMGETHFTVQIVADSFIGCSRVERHRMVYEALAEELAGGVHALALTVLAPGERGANGE